MIRDFLAGVTSYGKAFQLIGELRLWGYMLVPGLISLVLAIIIGSSAWALSDNIGGLLLGWWPWEWGTTAVDTIGQVFGGLLLVAVGFILYKNLVIMLAGPFMSPLSEKIDHHLSGRTVEGGLKPSKMVRDLVRGVRVGLRCVVRELFFTVLLLLLGLIPVFAPFVAILIFIIQAYYAGFGNMDFTLERYHNYRGSVDFVRANRGLAIGNGAIFLLLLFTGVGFLLAPPLATIAATIETVKRV
jgi:CysZ protein